MAGSDSARKKDLENMFMRKDIKAIFCARGGYGSLRILSKINYDLIRNNPKIFMGFSDVTALLLAFYERAHLITFHGPMVRGLSSAPALIGDLVNFFSSSGPGIIHLDSCKVISKGRCEGRLFGGNLTLLSHMVGTGYLPSFSGSVLFFEDKGEPIYRIDRMLTHLKLSGHLAGVKGVLAGQFVECGDQEALEQLLDEFFGSLKIPVLSGFPIGHGSQNILVPVGIHVELDTQQMTLRFLESPLV